MVPLLEATPNCFVFIVNSSYFLATKLRALNCGKCVLNTETP